MIEDKVLLWDVPVAAISLSVFYGCIGMLVERYLQKKGQLKAAN